MLKSAMQPFTVQHELIFTDDIHSLKTQIIITYFFFLLFVLIVALKHAKPVYSCFNSSCWLSQSGNDGQEVA